MKKTLLVFSCICSLFFVSCASKNIAQDENILQTPETITEAQADISTETDQDSPETSDTNTETDSDQEVLFIEEKVEFQEPEDFEEPVVITLLPEDLVETESQAEAPTEEKEEPLPEEKVEVAPTVTYTDVVYKDAYNTYKYSTLEEAKAGVKEIMEDKKFGSAGNTMVIEEFMTGREVSVLSFVDGKTIRIMSSAQDHKRAKDGDEGLNTGGMGNFSPSPFYTAEVDEFCKKYIYQATVDAMAAEGRPFTGVIFFGLMLTPDGPRVLEYNARFGDPEAQVVLPRMKNDIIDVMEACIEGKLDTIDLQFEENAAVCVILASDGYPVAYEKGFEITGLENFDGKDDYFCFHAGTKFNEAGKIVTNGGRVLGITATGKDLKEARAKAYEATEWVNFANKYMRHDIGKAIDEAK